MNKLSKKDKNLVSHKNYFSKYRKLSKKEKSKLKNRCSGHWWKTKSKYHTYFYDKWQFVSYSLGGIRKSFEYFNFPVNELSYAMYIQAKNDAKKWAKSGKRKNE
jgi:hypothetical protein